MRIGEFEVPRVLLGTSPFIGAGQFGARARHYYERFYENPRNIEKVISKSREVGIRGIQALPYDRILKAIKNVELEIHEKFTIIATINSIKDVYKFEGLDVIAFVLHASITDSKNFHEISRILSAIRSSGLLSGLATHAPLSTLSWLLEKRLDFDLLMIPFNKLGAFMDGSPEAVYELARRFDKPIIGKKVLAAGRLKPLEALEYASKYVDIVALGVASEEEAVETFSIALELFK